MAVKTNLKDIGWMYHSPSKKDDRAEILVPPTSQIPMLGNNPEDFMPPPDDPRRNYYKDTDTPYIILSKQGGRRDLLKIKDPPEPKPNKGQNHYPRCDWYYLEDNALEDDDLSHSQQPYVAQVPEYMVHDSWNPKGKPKVRGGHDKGRTPFATAQDLPEENNMQRFDKRTKLQEHRKPGYGIRTEKSKETDQSKKPLNVSVDVKPTNEAALRQKARRAGGEFQDPNDSMGHGELPAAMGKLLSHGYAQDWQTSHDEYEAKKAAASKEQTERLRRLHERSEKLTYVAQRPEPEVTSSSQPPPWRPSGKGQNFQ